MPLTDAQLMERFERRDPLGLARLLTRVENGKADDVLDRLYPRTGRAHVIGVTGPPGVGKSTLVDALCRTLRKSGKTVGIVCVDPSSPFTGGAILGDRVRMSALAGDAGVFVRSMGTRGALGGLARRTGDVVRVLDAFGKDVVIIETVGVGQGEVEIARMADTTLVIEVPGLGDSIQAIKAGILEIADIFVVNKADRPGADRVRAQIEGMLELSPMGTEWLPPIMATVAYKDEGIVELAATIDRHREHLESAGKLESRRRERRESDLRRILLAEAMARFERESERDGPTQEVVRAVREGALSPYGGARRILAIQTPHAS